MRAVYAELLDEFLVRARELGIEAQRINPNLSGWSEGSVMWVEGYRTPSGIVTPPPLRYGVMKKRALFGGLSEEVRQVRELSIFWIFNPSDHAPAFEEVRGPMTINDVPLPFDWTGPDDWPGRVEELRRGLEDALVNLMD